MCLILSAALLTSQHLPSLLHCISHSLSLSLSLSKYISVITLSINFPMCLILSVPRPKSQYLPSLLHCIFLYLSLNIHQQSLFQSFSPHVSFCLWLSPPLNISYLCTSLSLFKYISISLPSLCTYGSFYHRPLHLSIYLLSLPLF